MYTVYCHTNKINGKRYVGITKQKPERRWQNGHGYVGNHHFYNAIKKYGWEEFSHEILFTNLTKKQAKDKEIELIAKWNLTNSDYGYNNSDGGDIPKPLSKESCRKISESLKAKYSKSTHPCVGRAMSSVCRAIMLDANNKRKKMVVQYTLDGVCVSEYPSLREMERQTGFHRAAIKDNINGKSRQSYGFIWKFKEE